MLFFWIATEVFCWCVALCDVTPRGDVSQKTRDLLHACCFLLCLFTLMIGGLLWWFQG